jgi:hypothetical protein
MLKKVGVEKKEIRKESETVNLLILQLYAQYRELEGLLKEELVTGGSC